MELRWCSIYGPGSARGGANALYLGSLEVARMIDRMGGGWFARLHYPGRESILRDCTDEASGRRGCEAWAHRHRAELEAQAERTHLEWVSRQTWRGQDALEAGERLLDL